MQNGWNYIKLNFDLIQQKEKSGIWRNNHEQPVESRIEIKLDEEYWLKSSKSN